MKQRLIRYKLIVLYVLFVPMSAFPGAETIQQLWATDGFSNPESVVYDEVADVLYVSNVNGSPAEKDDNGFISMVSLDGKILKLDWVTGMNAPKGLAIYGGKLYTADIDTLVEIDIATASIINRYPVADAKFLNDVAAGNDGKIFVSDMMMNRIHCLDEGKFSIWLESPELLSPNGLLIEQNRVVVGSWGVMTDGFATEVSGHLLAVSLSDKSISSIGDGTSVGNLDGVERDQDGNYYVTDWMAGKLFYIQANGEVEVLLTLVQGMADHEYIAEKDLVILPMMNTGQLLAFKLHLDM